MLDDADVYIGDNVMIAPNVSLMAASHPLIAHERLGLMCGDDGLPTIAENAEPIRIGNNVWIGCNVTVIGGVTIGNDVVIGAGSVVLHDIPDGTGGGQPLPGDPEDHRGGQHEGTGPRGAVTRTKKQSTPFPFGRGVLLI